MVNTSYTAKYSHMSVASLLSRRKQHLDCPWLTQVQCPLLPTKLAAAASFNANPCMSIIDYWSCFLKTYVKHNYTFLGDTGDTETLDVCG